MAKNLRGFTTPICALSNLRFFQGNDKLKTAFILNFCNIFMKASTHKRLCFSAFKTGASIKFYGELSIFLSHNDVCENDIFLKMVCGV